MRFPFSWLALSWLAFAAQAPLQGASNIVMHTRPEFAFKEAADVFTPKNLVELTRPEEGKANDLGDLVLVPISKYSLEEKKNEKSIVIAALEAQLPVTPLHISLPDGGEAFWLDSRTVGHAVPKGDDKDKHLELYALSIEFNTDASVLRAVDAPPLIGRFPTSSATNFRYSPTLGYLVFSDYVYSDGNLTAVKEKDDEWENRGTTAKVYDSGYPRHWDHWLGPKTSSLFSVSLDKTENGQWVLGTKFFNYLAGTGHSTPVEPFGGTDDFDVSAKYIVYTSKDPYLPEPSHTKQNVYIVDIEGGAAPKELTSGKQGATHHPTLSNRGDKVAWLELDEDGYESDRAKIVVYDLVKDVRYTLTQKWDRSPDNLAFSKDGTFIYFTAGDEAKIKILVIPVPPTPEESTTHPDFSPKYNTPVTLTKSGAASGIQMLSDGRVMFTKSSFASPNDVFILRGLKHLEDEIQSATDDAVVFKGQVEQITHLTELELEGRELDLGEEFWFKGADGVDVQGWALKPKGFKHGERKRWPVVLLIHGGPQGAWEDQWSNRWNPNVFAQQGYFTLAINPTGSTTFGQQFTDSITEDWGGKPFIDMVNGWNHALEHWPEIDADRAVAAGGSWGGYAINWIQGHPEYGFGFKALVCHDGVFDTTYNGYSTDELFFFNHDWGGRPWEPKSKALSEKYGPSNFVHKWSTPQLLIHGSKDYRLPETESIGAFNALQQRGIPSRLVIFPDENHWVLNHGNSLKWHYEVFRWFDQFVGDY